MAGRFRPAPQGAPRWLQGPVTQQGVVSAPRPAPLREPAGRRAADAGCGVPAAVFLEPPHSFPQKSTPQQSVSF